MTTFFDIELGADGDLLPVNQLISGDALIRQRILNRLRTFTLDWFLDTSVGIDYLGFISVKTPVEVITEAMRVEISEVPGVASVDLTGTFDNVEQRYIITGDVGISTDPADADLVTITIVSPERGNSIPWAAFFGSGRIAS